MFILQKKSLTYGEFTGIYDMRTLSILAHIRQGIEFCSFIAFWIARMLNLGSKLNNEEPNALEFFDIDF